MESAASVPDLHAYIHGPGLRRVQSECSHLPSARAPLLRIHTERLALEPDAPGDGDECAARSRTSPEQPSPLRAALLRLAPVSLHAEIHDRPAEPKTPISPRRELSLVFERRCSDHRARLTVTADLRLIVALVWLALLTTAAAMSATAISHARPALAPASAFGHAHAVVARRRLVPEEPMGGVHAASLALPAARAVAHARRSLLVLHELQSELVGRLAPATCARRAVHAASRSAAPLAAARARARSTPLPAAAAAAACAPVPATVPPVSWAGGRSRAQRLALSRHARRLAFTLEPVARALGCTPLICAISEASCALLLPDAFQCVRAWHRDNLSVSAQAIAEAQAQLGAALAARLPAGAFTVAARAKSRASVFDKAVLRGKAVGDLLAARIVIDDAQDCAAVGTIVALLWGEEVHRRKDYVAHPKANGYQSLHMTVRLPCGRPLEVQIRTRSMHAAAERGSACWTAYKAGGVRRAGAGSGSWARALEGVRCLQAQQPERLRETLARALGASASAGPATAALSLPLDSVSFTLA